jgi:hypothetical protein
VILFQSISFAKVIYWPESCQSGELKITNTGSSVVSVWLQRFGPFLEAETEYQVNTQQPTTIRIESNNDKYRYSLLAISTEKLKVVYDCGGTVYPSSEDDNGKQFFKKHDPGSNKLWVRNLYPGTNTVKVEILNSEMKVVESSELQLNMAEVSVRKLTELVNWTFLKVSSSHKFSSFLIGENSTKAPEQNLPFEVPAEQNAHYFLVSPRSGTGDSFVVNIKTPEMVEKARQLIKNPASEKIVLGRIQKDHSGFNRNFSSPNGSFWSWSVTDVTGFGDFGSTACNGNPQMVEDRVDSWLENPGQICFWSYRLKRELTKDEVASGRPLQIKKPVKKP